MDRETSWLSHTRNCGDLNIESLSGISRAQRQRRRGLFKLSGPKLENFYGIEIDDFAHEIAILSLWLAKHQMNVEFQELFGVEISLIPLKDTGNIVCGNAARTGLDDCVSTLTRRT